MKRRIQELIDEKLTPRPFNALEMLTSREVARYLRITHWTLLRWRRERRGPPYVKLSRRVVRYPRWRFENFVRARLREGPSVNL